MTTQSTMTKQSFPEVVSYLSNPFQKNNLNFSLRNQQNIITPKMASEMRYQRAFNPKLKTLKK